MPVTETALHPPARNPWDPQRSPGGSSGGSGAAVAAGLVPIAQGSDGGGSVRIPSAFCHLYGFKPSLSLLGNLHGRFNQLGISVMGPLARTVEDAAAMLDVMAGRPDGGHAAQSCLAAARRAPRPLRVHLLVESSVVDIEPDIAAGTRAVAQTLEDLGHSVTEVTSPGGTIEEFLPVWRYAVARVPAISERLLQPVTRWVRGPRSEITLAAAQHAQRHLSERVTALIGDADILLSPTVGRLPPRIGEFNHPDPEQWFHAAAPIGAFTVAFNLTTGPAASLPMGLTHNGLPYGVQIGGRVGHDDLILALSRQLEQAMPWHARVPPGFGLATKTLTA